MAKAKTGPGVDYTGGEQVALTRAAVRGSSGWTGQAPTKIRVRADIEWAGVSSGVRATTLDGLNTAGVMDALGRARDVAAEGAQAAPLRSYRARGPVAMVRQLLGTRGGREALSRHGVSAGRTREGWLSGRATPSAANRSGIEAAYSDLRDRDVRAARDASDRASRAVTEELTQAIRDRYGSTVRFRDVQGFEFRE